ncbi:hypothetical protein LPJ55_005840 [Coemansia sp. RSA 990]|nr:hypothetical protein LPJ55_005840 [Coemansia sp. RSA 990]
MSDIDWFTYFLHPESLKDFELTSQKWTVAAERQQAGLQVLQGLLCANNFRDFVTSAYPSIGDLHRHDTLKSTPPSTPLSSQDGGFAGETLWRVGQCSRFEMDETTGLPKKTLSQTLKDNSLPELTAHQKRILGIASKLTELVGFDVEQIEANVHATIRFIYYLHLLESLANTDNIDEHRFQYRRWCIRSAYREEEVGLSLEVESSPAMESNCTHVKAYADALNGSDENAQKFRILYDLARVYLAQSRFEDALQLFNECQRLDPEQCAPKKFAVGGNHSSSIDEYAAACTKITQSLRSADTEQFSTMSLSDQHKIAGLIRDKQFDQALKESLTVETMDGCLWIDAIHPHLLHYYAKQTPEANSKTKRMLDEITTNWIAQNSGLSADRIRQQAAAMSMLIAGDDEFMLFPSLNIEDSGQMELGTGLPQSAQRTIAECQMLGVNSLSLDTSKPALAMLQLSYCYLAGLRMLEKEQYQQAQVWFVQGQDINFPLASHQTAGPIMAQNAEKDKVLKSALEAQLEVHAKLADVCFQLQEGTDISDLSADIDAILEAQVPVRFEFMERFICLQQGNKPVFMRLVNTLAANQKLYQQLPDTHMAMLQIASLLASIRDTLLELGIDTGLAMTSSSSSYELDLPSLPAEPMERLYKSVAEIATLLQKIPLGGNKRGVDIRTILSGTPEAGTKHENEIERFCRLWGDGVYLILLGALLAEIVHTSSRYESVDGPLGICRLVAYIIRKCSTTSDMIYESDDTEGIIIGGMYDEKTKSGAKSIEVLQDIALTIFRYRIMPENPCIWLYFSAVAAVGSRLEPLFMPLFLEYLSIQTNAFDPEQLDAAVKQPWFQSWIPRMIESLKRLEMGGAAVVLYQCSQEINYAQAISQVVQAFESNQVDFLKYLWDPNIIEYAGYLSKQSSYTMEFAVPSEELIASKSLILASYFEWLSGTLINKQSN